MARHRALDPSHTPEVGMSLDRGKCKMTTNRREMLCRTAGTLTGLAFTGCGLVSPASAQEPQWRREVIVNGKRVRTVDVHAHCHIPEANALMGLKVQLPSLVISRERAKGPPGNYRIDF